MLHVPELRASPVPYARPDFAAVRAASWAPTDRAAAALLAMVVQQRLTTDADLLLALGHYPTSRRHALIAAALLDVGGGSHSIGELEFVRHLRRRLPLPERQVQRTGPKGRVYLDACWPAARLVVEIDGSRHGVGAAPALDALRQNAVSLDGDIVLRVPNIALRTDPEPFLDQIENAVTAAGAITRRGA